MACCVDHPQQERRHGRNDESRRRARVRQTPRRRGRAGARGARRPGAGQGGGLGRVPHRPACRQRRLAGEAFAALHPGPRGHRLRGARGPRRQAGQGGRPRRRALAAHCLRPLRALHHRLGDAVRRAADDRLQRQRRLRRVRARRPRLHRPPARHARLRGRRAGAVCRGHGLQGPEGAGLQAWRLGGRLGHRRPGPHGGAVREGDGLPGSSPWTSPTTSCSSRSSSAPT